MNEWNQAFIANKTAPKRWWIRWTIIEALPWTHGPTTGIDADPSREICNLFDDHNGPIIIHWPAAAEGGLADTSSEYPLPANWTFLYGQPT